MCILCFKSLAFLPQSLQKSSDLEIQFINVMKIYGEKNLNFWDWEGEKKFIPNIWEWEIASHFQKVGNATWNSKMFLPRYALC